MNKMYFKDLVRGQYGRRIPYVDFETVTPDNIMQIMSEAVGVFNSNLAAIDYLWNYKKGDQPALYRTKTVRDDIVNHIVENHAFEIVKFCVSQTYGEPIQYVCTNKDESKNEAVDKLNTYMNGAFKFQRNVVQGEWKSAVGTSYLAIQKTGNDKKPFRIVVPTPLNTCAVYSSITGEHILSFQRLKDSEGKQYFHCFSDALEFVIRNGKLVSCNLHAFGGIPIVEIPNDFDRMSDIEIVITLLDSINTIQSNRADSIEQFVQSWVKFVNCSVDKDAFTEMKRMGALVVKSNNGSDNKADVDIMSQELNQTESQVAKDDYWNNSLSILAIPNKQGNTGGDTQGAVELRNGWDFSKGRAKLKDSYVKESEKKIAEVILNILRVTGNQLDITIDDFEVQINHSPTDNMLVKAQCLQYLLDCGIHPLIAIQTCGLWGDAEKVFLNSKEYMDKKLSDAQQSIPDADEQKAKAEDLKKQFYGD